MTQRTKIGSFLRKTPPYILIILLIAALLYVGGLYQSAVDKSREKDRANAILQQALTESLVRGESLIVDNKTFKSQIKLVTAENKELKADLKRLKAEPKEIRVITVAEPGTVVEIETNTFPPTYTYELESGMKVAKHTYQDNLFTAKTYDLGVDLTIVTSETKDGQVVDHVQTFMHSSAEDTAYPVQAQVTTIVKEQTKRLRLGSNAHFGLSASIVEPNIAPSITLSALTYGTESRDIARGLGLRAAYYFMDGSDAVGLGLDIVGLNIADRILLYDTWIWFGGEWTAHGMTPTVTISSTL